jgi:hypothetical protein
MPDKDDIENMPDDINDRDIGDYESPYPIDDRHLLDSVYNVTCRLDEQVTTMFNGFKTLRLVLNILLSFAVACLFGSLFLFMAGVV